MSQATRPEAKALSLEQRIDQLCSSFEAACKAAVAGDPWPRIEDVLAVTATSEREAVLCELILLEVHYRRRAGQNPACAEYQDRFPALEAAWLIEALTPQPGLAVDEVQGYTRRVTSEPGEEPVARLPQTARPAGLRAVEPPPNAGSGELPEQLGDYRILREIGRGGMGVVYEAMQESLGRHVALKVLPFHSLLAPTHRERFQREARAAARLHHSNIVPVFGVGVHHGLHYYAMQYIEGQGLDRVLRELRRLRGGKSGPLDGQHSLAAHVAASLVGGLPSHQPRQAQTSIPGGATRVSSASPPPGVKATAEDGPRGPASAGQTNLASGTDAQYFDGVARVGVQVAEALAYAHRQGILHRDIKPSNLLLDTAGTVWVTDFGLAKAEDSRELTSTGDIVGTVRYMPPERFAGQADARSDVYSMGLTLYELLTLRPAFEDSDPARLMLRVRSEAPLPPRQVEPHVPRDLETVVLKAMAKERRDRYATAELLAEDLRRFLADRPVLARRTSPIEQAWRWSRRNPAWTALIAMVVVLLVGGSATAIWYVQDRAQRAAALAVRKSHIEQEIEVALQEATMLGDRGWKLTDTPHLWETTLASALSTIRRAEALAGDAGDLVAEELLERVRSQKANLEADERDRHLVAALEQIQLEASQVDVRQNRFVGEAAIPRYLEVFRGYGVDAGSAPADQAAQLIRSKRAPVQLAVIVALDTWLMIARKAGADRGWPMAVVAAADTDEWRTKVRNAAARQDRETLERLVDEVVVTKQPPASLILLKSALQGVGAKDSAIRLLRRGQQQFPADFWINHELGDALLGARKSTEAAASFRVALALRPGNPGAQYNLGLALQNAGDLTGAIAAYLRAVDLDPRYVDAHMNLGVLLWGKNDLPGAIAAYRKTIELDPKHFKAYYNLRLALRKQGDSAGAIAAYRRAIDLNREHPEPYYDLGNALWDHADLAAATAAYQKAIQLNSNHAQAHCNLGAVLALQGKFAGSLLAYRRGHELGSKQKGWQYPSEHWVREAERRMELHRKLPAIISGQEQSKNAAEQIEYAEVCGYKGHNAAGVRLYQAAFASQPALAEDVRSQRRYSAACLAARAGTGQGEDAGTLKKSQHAELRKLALDWLRADLAGWTKLLDSGQSNERSLVQKTFRHWQRDPDLAALRDDAALAKLPEQEQMSWRQFWADVAGTLKSLSVR
jgi:serine/threonine protein kinase/Flp pilus assembly protein TadD